MNETRARVISQERGLYRLCAEGTEKNAEVSGRFMHDAVAVSDYPTVGDYVTALWPEDDSNAVITAVFPRKSALIRKASGPSAKEQLIAANVDTLFLCMSLNNDFNVRRLERYLSVAYAGGCTPVILLTKADLCADIDEKLCAVKAVASEADILTVSALTEDYDAILPYLLPGRTVAFIGSSGVGKSTLTNKLLGEELLETQGLRNDDKGRHTTTRRALLTLPNGAFVIDTPGMRELGMWEDDSGISETFSDIAALETQCRFSDCTHTREPGCAVRKALESGAVSAERWESYRKLMNESSVSAGSAQHLAAKREKFREIAIRNRSNRKR